MCYHLQESLREHVLHDQVLQRGGGRGGATHTDWQVRQHEPGLKLHSSQYLNYSTPPSSMAKFFDEVEDVVEPLTFTGRSVSNSQG